jgi:DNA-binding response OmpR family regulator
MNSILIIEDNPDLRETISSTLELNGYSVQTAPDGIDGLESAAVSTPDLVICDVHMPRMNGLETISKFRENDALKFVPFIFLSALSSNEDIRNGMNLGANDYLTKPFDHIEFLDVVRRQIVKKKEFSDVIKKESNSDLKVQLVEDYQELFDSLKSARTVQQLILPTKEKMNALFPKNFKFYEPKDIVSGDFFWINKEADRRYIAVADCTGHGIPGALLTMIYYQILNSSIELYGLQEPKDILKKTNELMIEFMTVSEQKIDFNGMDIVLCCIQENEVQFAGAIRPLFVSSEVEKEELNESLVLNNGKHFLYHIRGSRYSIGNSFPSFEIEQTTFSSNEGDRIYLTSDGISDQFGGPENKKFKSSRLKALIFSTLNLSIDEQGNSMKAQFKQWKGTESSVDDVAIIGIEL